MPEEKSSPHHKFTSEIIREIDGLLASRGIYKIGSYGWINENDADPDLIGHAMWQTESLSMCHILGGGSPNSSLLEDWQKFLMVAGSDFDGLMEAARISIGLVIFQSRLMETPFQADDDAIFQLHLMSSMMLLGAASDRIRDVFIAAVFHTSPDIYQSGKFKGEKRSWYATPFKQASGSLSIPSTANLAKEFCDARDKLSSAATEIHRYREQRNDIVHKVATEMGRREKHLIENPELIQNTFTGWDNVTADAWKQTAQRVQDQLEKRLAHDISIRISWYQKLVEFSNSIFLVEHQIRAHAEPPLARVSR